MKGRGQNTTLTVRLPKEEKETLMKYAEDHDLSASQIVRQLIRKYLFNCNIAVSILLIKQQSRPTVYKYLKLIA